MYIIGQNDLVNLYTFTIFIPQRYLDNSLGNSMFYSVHPLFRFLAFLTVRSLLPQAKTALNLLEAMSQAMHI